MKCTDVLSITVGIDFILTRKQTLCRIGLLCKERETEKERQRETESHKYQGH